MIDDATLDELDRLERLATAGPWTLDKVGYVESRDGTVATEIASQASAVFIAAARNHFRPLLDEVRRLRGIVRDLASCRTHANVLSDFYDQYVSCCRNTSSAALHADRELPHAESCPWRRAVEAVKP